MADGEAQPIIIKKVKGHGHGHHGGAWKVAYADFVTAMMAFFLLLWLLNATTEEQRAGIADYFSPQSISSPGSGAGGILGGKTIAVDGAMSSMGGPTEMGASIPLPPTPSGDGEGGTDGEDLATGDGGPETPADDGDSEFAENGTSEFANDGTSDKEFEGRIAQEALEKAMAEREQAQFEAAADALRQAIQSVDGLEVLKDSLIVEQTREGLRIQLVDQEGYSMFALGSSRPNEQMQRLVDLVTKVVAKLPNKISIAGHTDAVPYRSPDGYTNWELSSDRANSARRMLIDSGLDPQRVALVQGRSDTEPLLVDDPTSPRNRRISVVLLRENEMPVPVGDNAEAAPAQTAPPHDADHTGNQAPAPAAPAAIPQPVTPSGTGSQEAAPHGPDGHDASAPRRTEAPRSATSG